MSMCLHVGDVAKEAVLSELFFIVFSAIKAETLEGKTPGSELGIGTSEDSESEGG